MLRQKKMMEINIFSWYFSLPAHIWCLSLSLVDIKQQKNSSHQEASGAAQRPSSEGYWQSHYSPNWFISSPTVFEIKDQCIITKLWTGILWGRYNTSRSLICCFLHLGVEWGQAQQQEDRAKTNSDNIGQWALSHLSYLNSKQSPSTSPGSSSPGSCSGTSGTRS